MKRAVLILLLVALLLVPVFGYGETAVGSIITFGSYEQDGNESNGKEPIEWVVLAKKNNRILVISRYALDNKPYHEEHMFISWEHCDLREWLNDDFVKEAFSSSERAMIPVVTVPADENTECSTPAGEATRDQVFLLSMKEANEYFASDEDRACKPTAYAKKRGVWANDNGGCWWWLRTPGEYLCTAALVYSDGDVSEYGDGCYYAGTGVRPAMWIDLGY